MSAIFASISVLNLMRAATRLIYAANIFCLLSKNKLLQRDLAVVIDSIWMSTVS